MKNNAEKKNSKSFPFFILPLIAFLLAFLIVTFSFSYSCKAKTASENRVEYRLKVPHGMNSKSLSDILYNEGIIRSGKVFYLGARFPFFAKVFAGASSSFSLKSGIYRLSSDMSVKEIYEILSSGKQEYIKITFPEGLTKSKIGIRLEDEGVCSKNDFLEACSNPLLLKKYDIPSENFEGYLFPDTYFFTPMMSGEAVLSLMVENFFEHIKDIPALNNLSMADLDYNVRLASIVEREYRLDEEAPLIASVFKNRLKYNWGLYSCATIEYIITEIEGRPHPDVITYKDLQIDSPYNTYKWAGLPPTGISNPGLTALKAAVNAPKTKYFYFRLVNEEIGKHVFTEDFSQHISEGYSYSTKKSGR
ncbi:MAG: endolytic transglycosylase MltG [Treponema sp.]|nr:endolytic transglycosylase MltG [Treponema sp.]